MRLTLLGLLVVNLLPLTGAEDPITLNAVRLPSGNIELQCTATGNQSETYAIRLGCDIRESKLCRENCNALCPIINGKLAA